MRNARRSLLVMITAPNLPIARKLTRAVLVARAAACGNLVPKLESHYWWQGKLERSAEVLILFKTLPSALPRLERIILENHPYDTPEIITFKLDQGTPRYLDWLVSSVRENS